MKTVCGSSRPTSQVVEATDDKHITEPIWTSDLQCEYIILNVV